MNLLGAALPAGLMPAAADNPAGFWESVDIVAMNTAALEAAGSCWDDVLGPTADWFASAAARDFERRIADRLAGDVAGHRLIVIKDPRICRLLPSWRRAIEQMDARLVFVTPIREPLEVAHSLARRDQFSTAKSCLLWLRHLIDAERHSRGAPRVFVSYAELIDDWTDIAERIRTTLRLTFPIGIRSAAREIDRFLAEELRHHRGDAARTPDDGSLIDWIDRAWTAAQAAIGGDETPLIRAANDIASELARVELAFGPIIRPMERQTREAAVAIDRLRREAADERDRLGQRLTQERERQTREAAVAIDRLRREAADERDRLGQRLTQEHERRIRELTLELERQGGERQRLSAAIETSRLTIARLESAIAIRDDALRSGREKMTRRERWSARFAEALSRRDDAIGHLHRVLAARDAAFTTLGNELSQARASAHDLKQKFAEQERKSVELQAKNAIQAESLAYAKTAYERTAAELASAIAATERRDAEISKLRAKLSSRDERLAELQENIEDASTFVDRLRIERNAAVRRAEALAEASARLKIHRQAAHNRSGAANVLERRLWRRIQQLLNRPIIWSLRQVTALFAVPVMLAEATIRWRWKSGMIAAPFGALPAAALLRRSPLFDRGYYVASNPVVRLLALDPVLHYLAYGAAAGRAPHPLFDPAYYHAINVDVAARNTEPLWHFLRHGVKERRRTHPLFDCDYYLAANPEIAASGEHPLLHYLRQGWTERRSPHPLFDPTHYLTGNPDVAAAGADPLVHYVRWGGKEGREPHPAFDAAYYHARNVDVAESGLNPLIHYLRWGESEGRRPNANFDPLLHGRMAGAPAASTFNALAAHVQNPAALDDDAGNEAACAWRPFAAFDPLRQEPDAAAQRAALDRLFAVHRLPTRPDAPPPPDPDDAAIAAWRDQIGAGFDPGDRPEATVIVPVFNQLAYTLACLMALAAWPSRTRFDVIVVDDGSSDATADAFSAPIPGLRYLRNAQNIGFVRSCNRAAAMARGEYVVLLNNDTVALAGWLDALVDTMRREPDCGLVGSKLLYPDGRLQEAGGIVWSDASGWNYGRNDDPNRPAYNYMRPADYVSGASIMIRRELFAGLGGFDERYAPAYYEDTDLAFQVRARGLRALYQPRSMVIHFEGVSSGTDPGRGAKAHQAANRETFLARWRTALAAHFPPSHEPDRAKDRLYRGKLLFVDATTPTPDQDAGSVAADAMVQILLRLGWKVTFVPEDNFAFAAEYTLRLQARGVETVCHPYWTQFSGFAESTAGGFDVALVHRYETAQRTLVDLHRCHGDARIWFMNADLHYLREERRAALEQSAELAEAARRTRILELAAVRAADLTIVHSEAERQILKRDAPGAEVQVFQWPVPLPDAIRPLSARADIVFVGGYRHLPNVDAALWLAREIFPLVRRRAPRARLRLVGSHVRPEVAALAGDAVEVVGFVPDLAEELGAARVAVAPLRYGAGLKGKVIDAMRFGTPGVVTPIAAEGMTVEDGREVFVRGDAESFAAAVATLLDDDVIWSRMSAASRDYVGRRHSFAAAAEIVQQVLESDGHLKAPCHG